MSQNINDTVLDRSEEDKVARFHEFVSELFPEAYVDDRIDPDILLEAIGEQSCCPAEDYCFTWPGRHAARMEAETPAYGRMLSFMPGESVKPDSTGNLYIEGDNLEALKLLKENYAGRIKFIYIDPPYNTGSDMIFRDRFTMTAAELAAVSGDSSRRRQLQRNNQEGARYHTNWLNLMYPRLIAARELMSDDGAIFISIDDNEVENLKKLCDQVFSPSNFVGQWNWYKSATPPNLSRKIKKNIEYILCYEKKKNSNRYRGVQKISHSSNGLLNQTNRMATLRFPGGVIDTGLDDGIYPAGKYGTESYDIELLDDVTVSDGIFTEPFRLTAKFKWSQTKLDSEIAAGTKVSVRTKAFSPSYERLEYEPEVPPNLIGKEVGVDTTEQAGKALTALFDGLKVFDYPKPVELVQYLAGFICGPDDIILDFFSGSATTAHAVMKMNAEDGGHRRYILVQLREDCPAGSELVRQGYSNICEIGKERIKRAAAKLHKENPDAVFDDGFIAYEITDISLKED